MEQQLRLQTVRQFNSSGGGANLSAAYSQPFVIAASVTLFDAYLSKESFQLIAASRSASTESRPAKLRFHPDHW